MRLRGSSYFLIFILLLSLFVVITALTWAYFEAKILFLIFGATILVLGSVVLSREIRAGSRIQKNNETELKERPQDRIEARRFGTALGWVLGLLALTYLVGTIISVPVFVLAYLRVSKSGWLKSAIFALAFITIIYVAFVLVLKASFYPGFIFSR